MIASNYRSLKCATYTVLQIRRECGTPDTLKSKIEEGHVSI